jgi:hypothetical protein
MTATVITEPDYKIHCVEKENDRLIEAVRHTRQNALALAAAVLVIASAMLLRGEPLVKNLRSVVYDEPFKERLMGEPQTPKRDAAVDFITDIWDVASFVAALSEALTISLAVFIFVRSGRYAPILDSPTIEQMDSTKYLGLLKKQHSQLVKISEAYKLPLILAGCSALLSVAGYVVVTLLWLWFGSA